METNLIKTRLISFGYSLLSLILTAFVGVLASPDFATLVQTNFGGGITATLILLVVTELVKHLRNVKVINKLGKVGGGKNVII